MAMTSTTPHRLTAEPNVTPLIDVLLVLLIIFMVIVPVTPRGLQAMLPQSPRSGQATPPQTIVVQILSSANGPIYKINDQPVANKTQLAAQLNRIYSLRAEKVLFVKGDPTLDFASVAAVLDIGRALGIDRIGILTPGLAAS
ncbi:MAG TPA: biopolymer transporter ExbD [Acidobacteriaceae bacterium]|jgi:biopolymer transport protein ExbD|nr:biopolymer transporter ExbD [Acidobacteriaceae bacterium]